MGRFAEDLLARAAVLATSPKPPPRKEQGRNGNQANAWTRDREQRLIRLYNAGHTNTEIGVMLDKSANAIGIKINRLRNEGILGIDRPCPTKQR